jgi:hypothetical protein
MPGGLTTGHLPSRFVLSGFFVYLPPLFRTGTHGSRNESNSFVAAALARHESPQSGFTDIQLSVDHQKNTSALLSESVRVGKEDQHRREHSVQADLPGQRPVPGPAKHRQNHRRGKNIRRVRFYLAGMPQQHGRAGGDERRSVHVQHAGHTRIAEGIRAARRPAAWLRLPGCPLANPFS